MNHLNNIMPGNTPGYTPGSPSHAYFPPHPSQSDWTTPSAVPNTTPGYLPGYAAGPFEYFPPHPSQSSYMNPNTLPSTVPGYIPGYRSRTRPPPPPEPDYMLPSALPILPELGQFKYPAASLEGMPSEIKLEILHALHDLPSLRLLKLASREYYFAACASVRSLAAAYEDTYHPAKPWPRLDEGLFQGQRKPS